MVLALTTVPLVVLVKSLSNLELSEAIFKLDVVSLLLFGSLRVEVFSFPVRGSHDNRKEVDVNTVVENTVQNHFFTTFSFVV